MLRSYRLAFELERRIHRIDRYRVPLPYGLPLAAAGIALAVAVAVVAAGRVPVLGEVLTLLPLPIRLLLIPGVAAQVLCRRQPDGRPVYEAQCVRLVRLVSPRHLVGLERRPSQAPDEIGHVLVVADERAVRLRACKVAGPVDALLRLPATAVFVRRSMVLDPGDPAPLDHPITLRLRTGERLLVR